MDRSSSNDLRRSRRKMSTSQTGKSGVSAAPSASGSAPQIGGRQMFINYCSLVYAYLAGIASKSLVLILVARSLGPTSFGTLSFAISYVSLFLILADLGLRNYTTTEVARNANDRDKIMRHASRALTTKLIATACTFAMMVGIAFAAGYTKTTLIVIAFMSISYLLISAVQLVRAFFCGKELMHYEALIASVEGTLLIAVVLVCYYLEVGLLTLVAAWSGAMAVTFLLTAVVFCGKIGVPRFQWAADSLGMIRKSFFFGLGPHMAVLYMNLDTVFIKSMIDDDHAGYYQAAFRLVFTSVFLAANFMRFLYPLVTKMFKAGEKQGLQDLLGIYHRVAFAGCAPVLLFFVMFPSETIAFVYDTKYAAAAPVLRLLAIGFIIAVAAAIMDCASWSRAPALGFLRKRCWSSPELHPQCDSHSQVRNACRCLGEHRYFRNRKDVDRLCLPQTRSTNRESGVLIPSRGGGMRVNWLAL